MARTRREKTLADYVVIAISPALIMALVGSLVYFLLEVVYRGDYAGRIQWVLACFVFGAVLVARIGIEQGTDQAKIFGAALLLAAGVFALKFVDAFVIAWVLLAVISWCSWQLTWDCTLIDDDEDASGEGLLQAAGIDAGSHVRATSPAIEHQTDASRRQKQPRETDVSSDEFGRAAPADRDPAKPHSDLAAAGILAPVPQVSASSFGLVENALSQHEKLAAVQQQSKSRPHAPGLWVVYFSLAALPLFGIGQLLIPSQDQGRRSYAFRLLAGYVASALGLLLTTSFLGLRRYLRQRKLQMPAAMAGTWLGMGTALAVAVLAGALLIPRPQGEYTLTAMIDKLDQQVRDASNFAVLGGDRGRGEGRPIGEQDPDARQAGRDRQDGNQQPDQEKAGQKEDASGEQQPDGGGEKDQPADREGQEENESEKSSDDSAEGGTKQGQQAGQGEGQGQGRTQDQQQGQQQQQQQQGQQQQQQQQGQQQQQKSGNQGQEASANQKKDQGQPRKPQEQRPGKPPADQGTPPATPPQPPPATSFLQQLAPWFKWLIYGVLAAGLLYGIYRHWGAVADWLARLWAEFLSLFGFRATAEAATATEAENRPARPRTYADFDNPFTTGTARRMKPAQLLEYSFQALEAWAGDQGIRRSEDTTPLEFAQDVTRRSPGLGQDVSRTAQLYVQVAYAKKSPSAESLDILERLWRQMDSEGSRARGR